MVMPYASVTSADIAVIGAGPAGSTFSRLIGSSYRVALLDRRPLTTSVGLSNAIGKCCGGLLSPDAQKALAAQGLTLPVGILADPQIFAVRTMDLQLPESAVRYYPRSYVNMDRERFDRFLLSQIPDENPVEILDEAVCCSIQQIGDVFEIHYRRGRDGVMHTLTARALVGADGGGSLVRRTFFPRANRAIPQYVAVQEWYEAARQSPFYGAIFDRELTDCYGWLISKGDALILGAAFPQDRAAERFIRLKEKLTARGIPFGARLRREGCLVSRPKGPHHFCTGKQNIFLIGEAAGFISPSSLQGISYALDSGAMLAKALAPGLDGADRRYRHLTASTQAKLLGKMVKNPVLYTPFIRSCILRSGFASIPSLHKPPFSSPMNKSY